MTEIEIKTLLAAWEKRLQTQIAREKAALEADIVVLEQKLAELEYQIRTLQTELSTVE
jgi:uncharacterized protein involved in exopolysaccharide biosynthesis